jgi:tRNA (guanosine-2'-O-)-methyltransferase
VIRSETRRERLKNKTDYISIPVSFAIVNFQFDENAAFVARTAACYGINNMYVIGKLPEYKVMRALSGSSADIIKYKQFKSPSDFLSFAREQNMYIYSAELCENSKNLFNHKFSFDKEIVIVLGHETLGVPSEIIYNSTPLHIPMIGRGFCLNTSQAGTAIATEVVRQYIRSNNISLG